MTTMSMISFLNVRLDLKQEKESFNYFFQMVNCIRMNAAIYNFDLQIME